MEIELNENLEGENFPSFAKKIHESQIKLTRGPLEILQVNIGKLCNQACLHCHVEAGPKKIKENMNLETVNRLLELLKGSQVHTVDITGGAPELNPHFRYFVKEIRKYGINIIDRCNLTVLFEPGQEDTAEFLAENEVEVVASLPCYQKDNVEKQRGRGVFDKSIQGLKKLNALGYGKKGTRLKLNLVYNPQGVRLSPAQQGLEEAYKKELKELFNIEFNHLYTINNMPIKRFLYDLKRQGQLEEYMSLLLENFNVAAAKNVMCRSLVSISWDGKIFDCDFNQMLELPVGYKDLSVYDVNQLSTIEELPIAVKNHCYGCTAGAGSSCGGSLV